MNKFKNEEKGIILVVALLALFAAAIFLPALIFILNNETKWSVKEKKTTVAFQMAEQGLDRGVWKLQESDAVWNMISTGAVLPGYDFDLVYNSTDASGTVEGEYKVLLTTYTTGANVLIRSIGRDLSTNEVRAIEAVYSKTAVNAGLLSRGSLQYKPHLIVEWGPVIDYGGSITNTVPTDHPRIITKGSVPSDTDPNPPNGHDFYQTWPNPATYNYNTYQSKLGNAPTIDLASYKTIAKNSSVPSLQKAGGGTAVSSPTGSGYFTDNVKMLTPGGATYLLTCGTCVIYVDAGAPGTTAVDFQNTNSQVTVRALIMSGDFQPKFNGGDSVPNMNAKIPTGAQTEYYTPAGATYWTGKGWVEGNTYSIPNVRVHGYVYVGGNMNTSGAQDPVIIGALDIAGAISINNTVVYYDSTVSTGVLTTNMTPSLVSWREIHTTW